LPWGDTWHFIGPSGEEHAIAVAGPLRANNADAPTASLRAGIGIALKPAFVVWRDLREGRLEAVMTEWSATPIALNIVTPPGGPRPSKVTVLIEFLVCRFSDRAVPWAKS
jgi:DNA-binding transcriptional LysR family regulator